MNPASSLVSGLTVEPQSAALARGSLEAGDFGRLLDRDLARHDAQALHEPFQAQGAFIYLPEFLGAELTSALIRNAEALASRLHRNHLPGHKQGGSVSRHGLDTLAPEVARLYAAPSLIAWLGRLAGDALQVSPPNDPHAYALYYYTRPGDFIGWHYDTSYYAGRRYTALLGLIDESSCELEYQLHTRERGRAPIAGSVRIAPGGLVFFDGDRLRHRITPLGPGERRVTLTLEYVTDPHMHPFWRLVSHFKDALGYFGFADVFRRRRTAEPS